MYWMSPDFRVPRFPGFNKAIIHLSALLFVSIIVGCTQLADEMIEDIGDRTIYGPYEVDIPDAPHERFDSHDVTVQVYDPIYWMEIRYSIKNSGSKQAEVAIRINLLYRNDLEKETVKIKKVPAHSTATGTIEASWDDSDSDLLDQLIEDSKFEDGYIWENDEELRNYPIRLIFNAIKGPPGLKAEFEVEVEEL